MTTVLVAAIIVAAWYLGYQLAKSNSGIVMEYKNQEIKSLRYQLERSDKYVDTLFDKTEMVLIANTAYTAGIRRDETWSAEKWIVDTYKVIEPVQQLVSDEVWDFNVNGEMKTKE
jgi:hypothetical protein